MVKVTGNNMHGIITKMLFELPFFAKSTAKKICHIIAFCHIIEVDGIVSFTFNFGTIFSMISFKINKSA